MAGIAEVIYKGAKATKRRSGLTISHGISRVKQEADLSVFERIAKAEEEVARAKAAKIAQNQFVPRVKYDPARNPIPNPVINSSLGNKLKTEIINSRVKTQAAKNSERYNKFLTDRVNRAKAISSKLDEQRKAKVVDKVATNARAGAVKKELEFNRKQTAKIINKEIDRADFVKTADEITTTGLGAVIKRNPVKSGAAAIATTAAVGNAIFGDGNTDYPSHVQRPNETPEQYDRRVINELFAGAPPSPDVTDTPEVMAEVEKQVNAQAHGVVTPRGEQSNNVLVVSQEDISKGRRLTPSELKAVGLPADTVYFTNLPLTETAAYQRQKLANDPNATQIVYKDNGALVEVSSGEKIGSTASTPVTATTTVFDNSPTGRLKAVQDKFKTLFNEKQTAIDTLVEQMRAESPRYQYWQDNMAAATVAAGEGNQDGIDSIPLIDERIARLDEQFLNKAIKRVELNGDFKARSLVLAQEMQHASELVAQVTEAESTAVANPRLHKVYGDILNIDTSTPEGSLTVARYQKIASKEDNALVLAIQNNDYMPLPLGEVLSPDQFRKNLNYMASNSVGDPNAMSVHIALLGSIQQRVLAVAKEGALQALTQVTGDSTEEQQKRAQLFQTAPKDAQQEMLSTEISARYNTLMHEEARSVFDTMALVEAAGEYAPAIKSFLADPEQNPNTFYRNIPEGVDKDTALEFIAGQYNRNVADVIKSSPFYRVAGITTIEAQTKISGIVRKLQLEGQKSFF